MAKAEKKTGRLPKHKKIGELFVDAGIIDRKALAEALKQQQSQHKRFGQVLIDMGVANDVQIAQTLASQYKIPFLNIRGLEIPKEIIERVPLEMAENYLLIPVKVVDNRLVVAMANPLEFYALDDLRFFTQMAIDIAVSPQNDILEAIEKNYPKQNLEEIFSTCLFVDDSIESIRQFEEEELDEKDLVNIAELPPVIRFTNSILADAISLRASDIHIEPQKHSVLIRYRIDGIMQEIVTTEKHIHSSLVSRIKIISNIDISIRRKPQDGKFQVRFKENRYDVRVSTLPVSYGEKVTLRILYPEDGYLSLKDLEIAQTPLKNLVNAVENPHGIVLVTGPTGSGKSTTLYTCLNHLNSPSVNIITVEDPIEYDIKGINQVQVNPKAGLTFASGLRSILRQDPDIVMVGEIRDRETASIAFQAAMTGHLVFSTLHTNDAASAVVRLSDMGVDAFIISDVLNAVVGQRLVRKICTDCKIPDPVPPKIRRRMESFIGKNHPRDFWKGSGCESCRYTGYKGRVGLFEILAISPVLKEIISSQPADGELKKAAEKEGFQSMQADGIRKAVLGITTIDEVLHTVSFESTVIRRDRLFSHSLVVETDDGPGEPLKLQQAVVSVKPKKILLVEEDDVALKIMGNLLESQNYLVTMVKTSQEALHLAFRERPDLVITNLNTPQIDGRNLIQKLKKRLSTRFIPVLVLIGEDNGNVFSDTIQPGIDNYLPKPVDPKILLERIHHILS